MLEIVMSVRLIQSSDNGDVEMAITHRKLHSCVSSICPINSVHLVVPLMTDGSMQKYQEGYPSLCYQYVYVKRIGR